MSPKSYRLKTACRKHSQTIFTIEILIKILAASICMVDFFCKSMAASNFCDERKSALIVASHSSTGSPSGFSKDNLGPYVGKSVFYKNQRFNKNTLSVAMAQWKNRGVLIWGLLVRNRWVISLKVNFDNVLSILKKNQSRQSGLVRRHCIKAFVRRRGCCFSQLRPPDQTKAMFTLYRIGFCSVSKVAPEQCEQELIFYCSAEIVPKRSQCEQKPYRSHNLQRCLLIWKDHLPIRGSVTISAPIEVFRLDSDRLKNLSDKERSTLNSGAEQYCSGAETASKAAFLVWTEALFGTLSATLWFTIRYSVNIA